MNVQMRLQKLVVVAVVEVKPEVMQDVKQEPADETDSETHIPETIPLDLLAKIYGNEYFKHIYEMTQYHKHWTNNVKNTRVTVPCMDTRRLGGDNDASVIDTTPDRLKNCSTTHVSTSNGAVLNTCHAPISGYVMWTIIVFVHKTLTYYFSC